MTDFRKMTVQNLRDLARKTLGAEAARLRTRSELIAALEGAEPAARERPSRAPGTRAVQAAGKAIRTVKAAGQAAAEGARAAVKAGRAVAEEAAASAKRAVKKAPPGKAARAAVTGAVRGAAAAAARLRRAAEDEAGGGDPEGYFVARVRGEDAIREAPHPMTEPPPRHAEEPERRHEPERRRDGRRPGALPFDEGLGDLPWRYGDDAFVALPRDPRTLFLYWDWAQPTLASAFGGLDHPIAQLWVFARAGEGWDRLRAIDFALESRGYYVHDLEPGRTYRAEIHAIDRAGRDRLVGRASNEVVLPPVGPSPIVDDRFIRLPWSVPLGQLLGPGHAGAPFSDDARALLARMSDWARFGGATWGGSAGGMGGRPSSPTAAPSSPSSPFGPYGARER